MLKGIPNIIMPDLLKVLSEMGHGDELLIADGNYPVFGQPERVIRLDGHGIVDLLEAILQLMPLDQYVDTPVTFMDVLPDDPYIPEIWDDYNRIIKKSEENDIGIEKVHKTTFYERGKNTYAVVKTSEKALYANIILKKGVI